MAKVIDSFLVSLGFELDEKTNKEAQKGIDGIRTNALQMGAALSAAFAGTTLLIKNQATEIDGVLKQSKLLADVGVSDLDRFGFAFTRVGGSAEDAASTLENFEELLARADIGEGPFEDLAKAGIDPSLLIDTENSIELLEKLAEIYPMLDDEQKRLANSALGLNTGAQLLLREGRESLDSLLSRADELGTITNEMAKNSEDLVDATTDLDRAWNNLLNIFTGAAAPGVTESINDWTDGLINLQGIAQTLGEFFGDAFDELAPLAALLGGAGVVGAAGAGATALGAAGTGAALTGGATLAAGGALVAGSGIAGFKLGEFLNEEVLTTDQKRSIGDFIGTRVDALDEIFRFHFGPDAGAVNNTQSSSVFTDNKRVEINVSSNNPEEVANRVLEVIGGVANQAAQDFNNPIQG